jgi:prophage DNA circulation protein
MAIGCYTPPYLPGSFRAVPFKVQEASSTHGRNGAAHEYPLSENTTYLDTGRKVRTYEISARFDSNAHVLEAAALIAACELEGPGILVHPTRGIIARAACTSLTVRDSVEEEQGVTYVDMEFTDAGETGNPLSLTSQLAGIAFKPLLETVYSAFTDLYQVDTIQPFRENAVVAAAQEQVGFVADAYASATTTEASAIERNRVIYSLRTIASVAVEAKDAETVGTAVQRVISATGQRLNGTARFNAFRDLANKAAKSSPFAAPAGTAEDSVYMLVRTGAAVQMVIGLLESTDNRTDVIFASMDVVNALLDQEINFARSLCLNTLQVQLDSFKQDASRALADKAYTAPGVIEYDFSGSVSPLAAAYAIYNDARRHQELEALAGVTATGSLGNVVAALGEQ